MGLGFEDNGGLTQFWSWNTRRPEVTPTPDHLRLGGSSTN